MVNNSSHTGDSGGHPSPRGIPASAQFDPWIIWVTIRRCWPWAVPCGAVLAGLAAFVVLQNFVPEYRASHLLEANNDAVLQSVLRAQGGDLARTEKPLFFNSIVLDPVLENPALRSAPSLSDPLTAEPELRSRLSISNAGSANRLYVNYQDTDKVAAALVCNAIVDSYLLQRTAFDSSRMSNLERWLQPEVQRWEQQVEERQLKVHRLSEESQGYAPGKTLDEMEDRSNLSIVTQLHAQVADLTFELAVLDAQQAMRTELNNETDSVAAREFVAPTIIMERIEPSEQDIQSMIAADQEVREIKSEIARYKGMIQDLEIRDMVRINRSRYEDLQTTRDELTAKLAKVEEEGKSRAVAKLNKLADEDLEQRKRAAANQIANQKREFEANLATAQAERASERMAELAVEKQKRTDLEAKLKIAKEMYDKESQRMAHIGGISADLQFAQEELTVANEVLKKLRDRVAAIQTERRQDGPVRTLAVATPPKSPVETVPTKKVAVVSLASFSIPFLLGLLWELRVRRITDGTSLAKLSDLAPVVGEVSRLPTGNGTRRGRRLFEESIDTLRSNLFLAVKTKNTRSIAIASSMSGEGKSSVSSQLAISIAKATGELVLLVDADLRCPDQHDIFGLEMGPGLCGVLGHTATLNEAVNTSLGDLVHVLPAGHLDSSPHRLINQSSMREFMDLALQKYSFVVVDTAPVLAAGETLAVVSAVDSTLLCVMRDVSRIENVTRTMRRLEASGANISGTVFSGVSATQYAYRYGNYDYAISSEVNS